MKKIYGLFILNICIILLLSACTDKKTGNENVYTEHLMPSELHESVEEQIGNQIPQWVSDTDWTLPMYVMTSTDIEKFDNYAKDNFPAYYDDGWTQEQSDEVYLGQGIEMFHLDNSIPETRIVYYPVILNGVIISGYQVYERLDSHEMSMQGGPHLVNQLNALMQQMALYDAETALVLGYNNGNTIGITGSDNGSSIGIVWDSYYILDVDHMEHREVDVDVIPIIGLEEGIVVDAMEPLCTERIADHIEDGWEINGGVIETINPEDFGLPVLLPENSHWIKDVEYCQADENNLEIHYYDAMGVDCILLAVKDGILDLSDNEYDESLEESWEGNTASGQKVYVKVQHSTDGKMVFATWEYNNYKFAIQGSISDDTADTSSIPKTALYVISNLESQ